MEKIINLNDLVDICGGNMTTKQITNEIFNYMKRQPEKLIITIEKNPNNSYNATIYMTSKDFNKQTQKNMDNFDIAQLKQYLKENLRFNTKTNCSEFGYSGSINVELLLEDEVITDFYIDGSDIGMIDAGEYD